MEWSPRPFEGKIATRSAPVTGGVRWRQDPVRDRARTHRPQSMATRAAAGLATGTEKEGLESKNAHSDRTKT